jgi:peptidyl-prolyl cis-trans isomerase D
MLKQLREKTKTILWIVVVAFVISIFAVWGMNLRTPESRKRDRDVVGSVNGEIVTREAYVNTYNELFEQMRMQKGEDYQPSEAEYRMIADQAWERVVQKILVAKEIEKRGIVVTDNELVTFLRRTPPPIVQQAFVNDEGQFDYQAYLAELSNPARDWTRLEQWARAQIPEMKLQNSLAAQVHVPENDVLEAFKKETIKVKATYVAVPIEPEEPPFEPAEHEVAELYEQVKDDYLEFEKRRIRVIQIDKKPSEEDELDVRGRLQEIMDEILAGADFAEAAGKYSDDYMSAENGGELGFISKGVMVPEFEEAAFALETGEISEPVRTEFGYHLIKVEERKTEEEEEQIKVRHILMKVDLGYDTVDSLRTVLDELFEEIKEKGFERAANERGLAVLDPLPFARGSFIQDLGYQPRIINFAFNYKPGDISSSLETEKAVFIVKIIEEIPESYMPMESIREQLVERIRRERAEEKTRTIAETMRREALTGGDLESVAHMQELEVQETPLFGEDESVPGIGVNTAFAHACHLLPIGELSAPVKGRDAFYLIMVTERTEPDMEEFTKRRPEITNQLRGEMASHFIAGWYDDIRQNAEVVDLREQTLD